MEMLDGEKWICNDHVIIDNSLIFYANGAFWKTDLSTRQTMYSSKIKNIEQIQKRGVGYLVLLNKTLFIISWSPMIVAYYDIELNVITDIYEDEKATASFISLEKWNNHLYLFRRNADEVIILCESGDYKRISFLPNVDKKNMRGCKLDDEMFFFTSFGSSYYKYDFKENVMSMEKMPFSLDNMQDATVYNQKIYILCEKNIIIWDGNEKIDYIDLKKDNSCDLIRGMMIPLKDKLYVLPRTEDNIICIKYDGTVYKYGDYPEDYHYTQSDAWLKIGSKYYSYEKKDGVYYFPRKSTNYMLTIDENRQDIIWVSVQEPSDREEIKRKISENKKSFEERGYLSGLIEYIKYE